MTYKEKIYTIIFESDTRVGKLFDILLLIIITLSTILVMLDSVESIHKEYFKLLYILEWFFTIIFTLEYIIRIYVIKNKKSYIFSFFGILDFISIIPTYLSLFIHGAQFLIILRVLRLFRLFRIFGLNEYMKSSLTIYSALKSSKQKIIVFLVFILLSICAFGGLMYVVESPHPESGFTNIPISIYWSIVTITTVGYGDVLPVTSLGRFIASLIMILGYAVIAVPTGIVSSELTKQKEKMDFSQHCSNCGKNDHQINSQFCNQCGYEI